jgi:protoporphyrinogen oxidase/cellulose synthase/poly-beta-1,6-N-acetylglucosamine synthase-like glycosyltransferase/putative flippase GtrA
MILYGGIGISAVVIDLSVFVILYNFFDVPPVIATILSVSIAMVYAFTLNAFYNFRTKDHMQARLLSYALVSGAGMITSALIIDMLARHGTDPNIAKMLSLPPIVFLQYVINKSLTFRKTKRQQAHEEGVPSPEATIEGRKVAVIGGGFTGLTAAYALAKKGYGVTVYEAEKTLGGLVSGFSLDGLPLERAYHFLYKTDSAIIDLAKEIGVADKLEFHPSSISLAYGGTLYPFMTPKDLLMFKPLSLIGRIRAGLVAVYLAKTTRWHHFANVSAMDWMRKWAGEEVTRVIWEPILRGKFFDHYDKIAMSYVWSRVYVRANSKDKGDVTEKLGYFDGGFQTFTNRLAERSAELGVTFKTGVPTRALTQGEGNVTVITEEGSEVFDACLATTPSHVFKKMIAGTNAVDEEYLQKLASVEYLGAILMVFSTDKKFTDYYWHNINDPDHPFLVLLSLSALVGTERLGGRNIYYVGAYVPHDHRYFTMSDAEIHTLWVNGIKKVFPDFDASSITDRHIFKYKNAQHIVEPGYEKKIVPYQSPLENIYLSNFSQIFPDDRGTNYAVAEGMKVVDVIDADLRKLSVQNEQYSNREEYAGTNATREDVGGLTAGPFRIESQLLRSTTAFPAVSIILPTFNEAENIYPLLSKINKVMMRSGNEYECIFVDDSTNDTASVIVQAAKLYGGHIGLIKRFGANAKSGLTRAFRRGFEEARGDTIVCMDTDLQHPPKTIPQLLEALDSPNVDVAVASRYTEDGSAVGLSDWRRRFVSRISTFAVWALLPATRATTDPMTGFFAFHKGLLDTITFSSKGFKVLVELLVGARKPSVVDVSFVFGKRFTGDSKATLLQGITFARDTFMLFVTDRGGARTTKYMLVAMLSVFTYFIVLGSLVLSGVAQNNGLTSFSNATTALIAIVAISAPFMFYWALKDLGYERTSFLNTSIVTFFIGVVLGIHMFIYGSVPVTIAGVVASGSILAVSYMIAYLALHPFWRKDAQAILSPERWFFLFALVSVLIVIGFFNTHDVWWHTALVILYVLVVMQGIFALYLMIYTWENPVSIAAKDLTRRFVAPRHSFTAIIPCKHEQNTIADTLRALSMSNYPEDKLQILAVIHESSDDGTIGEVKKAITALGKKNIQLLTYDEEPINKPHGLNEALKQATGEYVAIFDAEDEVHQDLFNVVNTSLTNTPADVVQTGVQLMNYDSNWYSTFNVLEYFFWFRSTLHFFAQHGVVPLGGVGVFFRRTTLEQVGGWSMDCLTEDGEIGMRLSRANAKIAVVYDAEYVTREETPPTVTGFIKQRTRWAQGFLQILSQRHLTAFPSPWQQFLAIYVLAWPLILPLLFFLLPFGIIVLFTASLPPWLALMTNLSLIIFSTFVAVLAIGLYEFTKGYGLRMSWRHVVVLIVGFYPYTLLLVIASARAVYRQMAQITTWEKTEHLNTHRNPVPEFRPSNAIAIREI